MGNTQPHRGRRFSGRRGRGNQSGARGPGAVESAGAAAPLAIPLAPSVPPRRPTPEAGDQAPPAGRRKRGGNSGRPASSLANGRAGTAQDAARNRRDGTQPFERIVPVVDATPAEPALSAKTLDFAPRRAASNGANGVPHEANGAAAGPRSLADMRSQRAVRMERAERGDREPLRAEARGDVGPLIDDLHAVFEHDRAVASQGSNARCGICYLHFAHADLTYREVEGFYVCAHCSTSLGGTQVMMIRRQQR